MEPKWPWEPGFLGPPADPWSAWYIVNESLYFNIAPSVGRKWLKHVEHYIQKADERWSNWYGSISGGPMNDNCFANRTDWHCAWYN